MIRGPFIAVIISNIRSNFFQRLSCCMSIHVFPVLYPSYNVKLSLRVTKGEKLTGF